MIEYTVIGGYLGAGKTTLLNHLLHNSEGRRFALLINDFGAINIDAQLIATKTDRQINLTNGCICCSLSDGFAEALDSLLAGEAPEHIVVEASGVADVNKLSHYGYGQGLTLAGVVVVADAETVMQKAQDRYVAQTVRRQLAAADLIVLNKVDLVTDAQSARVVDWLQTQWPGVPVVSAVRGELPAALLLGIRSSAPDLPMHYDHESYCAWSFTSPEPLSEAGAQSLVHGLGPDVLRAKGLLQLDDGSVLEVQRVGQRLETHRRDDVPRADSQLVAIGLQGALAAEQLDALAARCFAADSAD